MKMASTGSSVRWLTWIPQFPLMLDNSDHRNCCHNSNSNHLKPNVQPLHGSVAGKTAALVELQSQLILSLKPRLDTVLRLASKTVASRPLLPLLPLITRWLIFKSAFPVYV